MLEQDNALVILFPASIGLLQDSCLTIQIHLVRKFWKFLHRLILVGLPVLSFGIEFNCSLQALHISLNLLMIYYLVQKILLCALVFSG